MALLIPPCNIYNVDETGFNICQKSQKIVARKGKKSVGILTSAEKGKNITITCAAEPKFSRLFSPYQPTSCHFPFGWHHLRLLSRYLAVLQSLNRRVATSCSVGTVYVCSLGTFYSVYTIFIPRFSLLERGYQSC